MENIVRETNPMNKLKILGGMVVHEIKLLLRSKWLLNFTLLFLAMAALFYFYGLQSVETDPKEVVYGLESMGTEIDTGTVDPSYFGLDVIEVEENKETAESAGYSRAIAMLMNLSLWLIPVICLILGSNSIITDKEGGGLSLYRTYHMPFTYYVLSKFIALCVSLLASLGVSYGVFGIIVSLTGQGAQGTYFQTFLWLNVFLVIVFSALSLFIGSISTTRMQGLSFALIAWSFLVFVYEFIVFSVVDFVSYGQKLTGMLLFILMNPIESLRVWSIEKLNAEYIFGPEYLLIHEWGQSGMLTNYLIVSIIAMIVMALSVSTVVMKKRG